MASAILEISTPANETFAYLLSDLVRKLLFESGMLCLIVLSPL